MKRPAGRLYCAAFLGLLLTTSTSSSSAQDKPMVPYPEGYRAWRVIKVRIVGPENNLFATRGGIHLFFANDKAVEGFRTKHFADGAVMVEEIVQAKDSDGAFKGSQTEGARVSIDVKVKNDALFKDTGGWGYDTFKGDDKVSALNDQIRGRCFACHTSQKDRDFTFSDMRQ